MSTFKFISMRDIPGEVVITIGGGIKLSRTKWENLIYRFYPVSTDLELFFGLDKEWERLTKMGCSFTTHRHFDNVDMTWEDLAVALEFMPSKSQARKNGWAGPIEMGYSETKRKLHRFYILKLDINMTREGLLDELTKTYLPSTCKE